MPFNTLKDIVFDKRFRNSSSRALMLKAVVNGENCSLKFFTSPNEGLMRRYRMLSNYHLSFVPDYHYYENEINIVSGGHFSPQPLLLGHWIDGVSLSEEIKRLCQNYDKGALAELCDKLLNLFIELLGTDIVHGDLKFDNIIVGSDGQLTIVDWDAHFSPELKEYPTSEIGTTFFQHPSRCVDDYGKRVDDYSMALMVVSMVAYSEKPELYSHSLRNGDVLLSPAEILRGKSFLYAKMCDAWQYFPLRRELLLFLRSDNFCLQGLRKLFLRMAGRDKFDERVEWLIDKNLPVRKIVNKDTKLFGYIDSEENVIVDTMYGDCTMFGENIAGVRINSHWFFIDKRGRVLSGYYQKIIAFGGGLFSVKKDNNWLDISEKEIINL